MAEVIALERAWPSAMFDATETVARRSWVTSP